MSTWFGYPLIFVTFIICFVSALLGLTPIVPMQLAATVIVVCMTVCWACLLLNIRSDIKSDWRYLREAHKKRNPRKIATSRKRLVQNLLWLIFSPLAVIVSVAWGGFVLVLIAVAEVLDKFDEKVSA